MSILEANGSIACAECGRRARAEYDQLKAENAKLREFSKYTWRAIAYEVPLSVLMGIESYARKLGIEVD